MTRFPRSISVWQHQAWRCRSGLDGDWRLRACIGQSQRATLGAQRDMLVSRFGRLLTGATVQWRARRRGAGLGGATAKTVD